MCTQTRAAALMANIPRVDIDPSGVFKYVLIRVHSKEEGDDSEIDIVRGYGWAEYHGEQVELTTIHRAARAPLAGGYTQCAADWCVCPPSKKDPEE